MISADCEKDWKNYKEIYKIYIDFFHKELLKNNYNCKLVNNYKNVFAWKNLIYKNLHDKIKNKILSNNAKRSVEMFTWENRAALMLKDLI